MATGKSEQVTYFCRRSNDTKGIDILTTKGSYRCKLSVPEYTSAVIQGEEVIIQLKTGRTMVYTVKGGYRGTF